MKPPSMFAQFWSPHFAHGVIHWTFPIAVSALSTAESTGASPEQMRPSSGQLRTGRAMLSLLQLGFCEVSGANRGRKCWWL